MHAKRIGRGAAALGLAGLLVGFLAAGCSKKSDSEPEFPTPTMTEINTPGANDEAKMAKAEEARKQAAAEAFGKQITDFVAAGRKYDKFIAGVPATDEFAAQNETLRKSWDAITIDPDSEWQGATKELADRVVAAAEGEEQFGRMNDDAASLGNLTGDKELPKIKAEERKEHAADMSKRIGRMLDELQRCVKEQTSPKEITD